MRVTTLTILGSLLAASPALARGGGRMGGPREMGGPHNPMRLEAVAAQLGVDEATLTKIKDLTFKAEQEAIGIRAETQRAHLVLRKLMDADNPDEKAVMKQIDAVMAQEARMRKNRVGLLLAVRKLLTPEQRVKLEQLMTERRGPGRRGRGGPGMGGPGMGGAGMGGAGMGGAGMGGPGMGGAGMGGPGMGPGGGRGGPKGGR